MHDTPALDGDVIYANDLGPEANLKLARCYPRRALYYYWGTLDKAMLVPLRTEGDGFRPGDPVVVPASGKRQVELVSRPEDIFKVYSSEFGGFLRETFQAEGWTAVDGNRLRDIGLGLAAGGPDPALASVIPPDQVLHQDRTDGRGQAHHAELRGGRLQDPQDLQHPSLPRLLTFSPPSCQTGGSRLE
jgi:hypothetical protein